jgi:putative ABC transport system permease protein
MKFKDMASLALETLRHRSLRSWLAILGIVIGVAAIITLVSISFGLSANISSRLSGLGANIITISPGGERAGRIGGFPVFGGFGGAEGPPSSGFLNRQSNQITFTEADSLRTVPGVDSLDAQLEQRARVEYGSQNSSLSIIGTEPLQFGKSVGVGLYEGRYLSTSDQYSAVIGFSVANRTFNDTDIINKQIRINNVTFRIVGLLNPAGSSFGSPDSNVYIPQRIAKVLFNQTKAVSQLVITSADGYDTTDVANSLTDELDSLHRLQAGQEDFRVTTAVSLQSTVSSITDTLTLFLGGIASVALVVGGIGVANTMFMSVLEQTRYIGILKALGLSNRGVLTLFLLEASIIGFVGGVLGVLLSFVVSKILSDFGVSSLVTPELVLFGIGFSAVVGVVSGLVPARNASSVPPVEALRYE